MTEILLKMGFIVRTIFDIDLRSYLDIRTPIIRSWDLPLWFICQLGCLFASVKIIIL